MRKCTTVKYIHSSLQNDQRFLCIVAGTHILHAMLVTPKSDSIQGTDYIVSQILVFLEQALKI